MPGVKGMKRGAPKAPIGESIKRGRRRASAKSKQFSAWVAVDDKEQQARAFAEAMNHLHDPLPSPPAHPPRETSPIWKLREEVEMLHLQRTKRQLEAEINGGVGFPCAAGGAMSPGQVVNPLPKPSHAVQLEGLQQQINVLHNLREELAKSVELAHIKINALEDRVG